MNKISIFCLMMAGPCIVFAQSQKKTASAGATRTTPVTLPTPPRGEYKIFDQDGVSIFVKAGKGLLDGTDVIKTAVISKVVNANNVQVAITMQYIDGGKDKKHSGRFSVNSSEGCWICGYTLLNASTVYDDPSNTIHSSKSVGFEFGVEDISQVKIVGAQIKKIILPVVKPLEGAPKYGWVESRYQSRWQGGRPITPIYHTVSKVLDLSTLDVSSIPKKFDDGTAKTVSQIYENALVKWFLERLRAHHIDNAVDITSAAGGITAYTTRYDNNARREHLLNSKPDAENMRNYMISHEFVPTNLYRTPQYTNYLNDDLPAATTAGSASNTNTGFANTASGSNTPTRNTASAGNNSTWSAANTNKGSANTAPVNNAATGSAASAGNAPRVNSNTAGGVASGNLANNQGASRATALNNNTPNAPGGAKISSSDILRYPANTNEKRVYSRESIATVWSFTMTWPASPELGSITGKIRFLPDDQGTMKGSIQSAPGQRLSINDSFEKGILNGNELSFTVQTPVAEIQQVYRLLIIASNKIKGTIKNIAIKPTNRPANWDIPAEIELSR